MMYLLLLKSLYVDILNILNLRINKKKNILLVNMLHEVRLPNQIIPIKRVAVPGQTVVFHCMSENATTWFYEKMEVQSNVWIEMGFERTIVIVGVNREHAGYYYCHGKKNISLKPFLSKTNLILRGKFSFNELYQYPALVLICYTRCYIFGRTNLALPHLKNANYVPI